MSAFVDSLLDLLTPLGEVTARKMFGGYGIYKETLMFGLVSQNRFYIRTDEETKERFIDQGCDPFVFCLDKAGNPVVSKYYEPPEMAFANAQRMKPWATMGWECALRSVKTKAAKKKRVKPAKAEDVEKPRAKKKKP
jgi:DNA transformation protein